MDFFKALRERLWLQQLLFLVVVVTVGAVALVRAFNPDPHNYVILVNTNDSTTRHEGVLLLPRLRDSDDNPIEIKVGLGATKGSLSVYECDHAFASGTAKFYGNDGMLIQEWDFSPPGRINKRAVLYVGEACHRASFDRIEANCMHPTDQIKNVQIPLERPRKQFTH